MDKLVEHGIRMLEIVEGENDFFRNDAKRQADIARAVYDTILRVQALERKADRKTESNSEKPNNCEDEPQLTPNYCGTCKHREVPCGDLPCDVCHGYSNYEPKDEPQYDFGEYADRLWKIAYERGKREALEQTEPQTCSVNGRPYDCGNCEYFKCTADEPQTEVIMPKKMQRLRFCIKDNRGIR